LPSALANSGNALLALTLPLVLAGLLGQRANLYTVLVLSIGLVALAFSLEALRLNDAAVVVLAVNTVTTFALLLTILAVLLDRFRSTLLDALYAAQQREEELRVFQASLETTVTERTAELQETVDHLRSSQETIAELGAPVLPVLPKVLVAPLIGSLDSARIRVVEHNVLAAVERYRAAKAIFDITGVTVVDTQVAQALIRLAGSVRLLGAEPILVGIRPEVAQTIVGLGLNLNMLQTFPNLQEAIMVIANHE
jgi:anti-anti-sigma regulatory factor